MVFSELYSAYYNTVAKIISEAVSGNLSEKSVNRIVSENAFGESILNILPALREERWQVLTKELTTPIKNIPTMPLTDLQKQWLKAISLDPRIKLFDVKFDSLEDVLPLFTTEDYRIFDSFSDGDPYDDEKYIERFHVILKAVKEKLPLQIEMTGRDGTVKSKKLIPERLEYSEKDDKFRLISNGDRFATTINIAKITKCSIYCGNEKIISSQHKTKHSTVTLKITDTRNALERCMLHFAHFEKKAEKTGENEYRVTVTYDSSDRAEMLIRVLQFGPMVEVIAPVSFRKAIIEKLKKQQSCGLI